MELIISFVYILHQCIAANLDLFYFLSIILVFKDLLSSKKINIKSMKMIYIVIMYALIQIAVQDNIVVYRLIINLMKMYINIFLFYYIKDSNLSLLKLKKITYLIALINTLLLPISLIFKNSFLWRLNDYVNTYNEVRLQMFYFEPSELSFHVSLLVLILYYYFKISIDFKERMKIGFYIATNTLIIALSSGMGGILSLLLGICVIYVYHLITKLNLKQSIISIVLLFCITGATFLLIQSNSKIYLRAMDIINGKDGSVVYRYNTSHEVMKQMLIDSTGIGIGFGNLNTDITQGSYWTYGLVEVISNSFMYFIAEGGFVAILFLIILIWKLVSSIKKGEGILKYGLLIFILSYQIAGGYFTNPINWIVYGIICNSYVMREKEH